MYKTPLPNLRIRLWSLKLEIYDPPLKDILSYKPGTIIELDTLAGEAVEIRANGATVAHGEVVVLEEKYGVRIIDMV